MPATPPPPFGTHTPTNNSTSDDSAEANADGQTFQIRYDALVIAVGAYSQSPFVDHLRLTTVLTGP